MDFFSTFTAWLNDLLALYIETNTVRIAEALQPAIITLGILYVTVWGVLQILGRIEEPLLEGLKRIAVLALILGVGLHLWLYPEVIIDTFYEAPAQLARSIIRTYDPVTVVDSIMDQGGEAADLLLEKGGVLDGNFAYYLAGFLVYVLVGATAVYTMFLLALSRIALAVLLALGPLFIAMLFFDTTRRFVESWLAQLATYAFIAILVVLVAALMLALVGGAAEAASARGGTIQIADAIRVALAAGLTLLVMRQVPAMAAGLASGIALSSFGVVSGVAQGSLRHLGLFARGFLDKQPSRWDSASRLAGHGTKRVLQGVFWTGPRYLRDRVRRNTVRGS